MADNFVRYARLEPRPFARDLTAGFAAAIHDPVWFLGRQWQMGEHQGENASSPIWVNYDLVQQPLRAADPRFDPTVIPAEAIVESEIDDWWTMGRRVRMGQRLQDHPALQARDDLRFHNPPPPYERFQGQFDGRAVWRARAELGLADEDFGVAVPPDGTPAWDSERLLYRQGEAEAFATAAHRLAVQEHRGGRMDWYAVMATAEEGAPDPEPVPGQAIPTMLHYPGAPASRWWQIEDAEVDVGGYVPDSAHTPTAFLTELVFSHSDDWFLFPVQSRPGTW